MPAARIGKNPNDPVGHQYEFSGVSISDFWESIKLERQNFYGENSTYLQIQ